LALAATLLTAGAWADADSPVVTQSAQAGTPLTLRPTKPLSLEPQRPAEGAGWKIAAFLVAGAAVFCGVKHRARTRAPRPDSGPRVVGRTTIGIRSELLLVEIDGQRLLLGVTPTAIQSLYLPAPAPDERPESLEGTRHLELVAPQAMPMRALEESSEPTRSQRPEPRATTRRSRVTRAEEPRAGLRSHQRTGHDTTAVEEQARGLAQLGAQK